MKKEEKNLALGAGAGIATGTAAAAVATAFSAADASASDEVPVEEIIPADEEEVAVEQVVYDTPRTPEHVAPQAESDVEVLDYQHIEGEDGMQMDVAVVDDNGNTTAYFDTTGDGYADYRAVDANHNNVFEDNEFSEVNNTDVNMNEFRNEFVAQNGGTVCDAQDAIHNDMAYTGPDPMEQGYMNDVAYTNDENLDMPDYVNDADTDSFIS